MPIGFLRSFFAVALLSLGVPALADEPVRGGTLRFLVDPEPPTLVPIAHTAGATLHVGAKITEGLLRFSPEGEAQPELATAWSVSDDGLTYRFTIRKGVKWHDQVAFTPEDVAHSLELTRKHHPRGRNTFISVTTITVDGDDVVLSLKAPAPYILNALTATETPIVPKHLYETSDPGTNPNGNHPIGTGPFRFVEWVRGSHIRLARNPDYWDAGKPYLDEVIVRFIPDASSRVAALEAGEIDLTTGNGVSPGQIEALKNNTKFDIVVNDKSANPTQTMLIFNLDNKVLSDIRVRQAIAHSIDRQAVRNIAWYGYAQVSPTPIAPAGKYHLDAPEPYPLDLAKAEKLLDEAGYPRDTKTGRRLSLSLDFLPIRDGPRREGEYLRSQLAKIGIDITVRAQDFATYVKRVYTDRDFDLSTSLMGNLFDPTVGVQRIYWSKNFKPGLPFSNGSHYSNPEVDRLLEQAALEVNEEKRRALFNEFQTIVVNEIPEINLVSPDETFVAGKHVHNHSTTSDNVSSSFADVYIDRK